MRKVEIVARMAEEAKISKKSALAVLNSFVTAVRDALQKKGGSIRISDLGTFKVLKRKSRTGVNPQTGKPIKIPAMTVPRFSASKKLKETVLKSK
ncbi:MAG: HU family DNA-binding protein [Desulfomonilaceae bacterium]